MQVWASAGALAAEGCYGEAEALLLAVLQARPDLAEAHSDLGLVRFRLGWLDEAEAAYRQALVVNPVLPAAHYNLGILLRQQERLEEAIQAFRRAQALSPDHAPTLNNLGNCLRRTGALDEAREALEGALALQPDILEALYNLVSLKTYREGDPQIATILEMEGRVIPLPELSRIRYWFTRGKMLEDTGRFDEAFRAYAEGNALAKARTPWDEGAEVRLHESLRARFTRAWFDARPLAPLEPGPIPVFIVGMPRSGTSLLEQVLASCPGVHGAGELPFLGEVLREAAGGSPLPEALASATPEDLRALGRRYLERLRGLAPPGATHITDKMPGNFVHAGLIPLLLPGARIIHAMRDPMDSCLSCFTRHLQEGNLGYT
jgi:tetratricopeptide (TPR) repeat protein